MNIDRSQFESFVDVLLEKNQHVNLVARGMSQSEFFDKHVYDSVKLSEYLNLSSGNLLDIGAGGGLPGVPLAMLYPELHVTLLDSVGKKLDAVSDIVKNLELKNVAFLNGRTEELGHDTKYRAQFDFVTARAVAPLPVIIEYALPFLKVGGLFIAYKGPQFQEEVDASTHALSELGGKIVEIFTYDLPNDTGARAYVIIEKTAPTKKIYPRRIGVPKKSPL